MTEKEIKLKCLNLAAKVGDKDNVIKIAKDMFAWVSESKTPPSNATEV